MELSSAEAMAESVSATEEYPHPRSVAKARVRTIDRIASFRIVYLAIFVFAALTVVSLDVSEILLQRQFERAVSQAVRVNPVDGPVVPQIQRRIRDIIESSAWIQIGGVRVSVHVYGADGVTPLYLEGRTIPPPAVMDPVASIREAVQLLPASYSIEVSLPPTGLLAITILVVYGTLLITTLFFYNRAASRNEASVLAASVAARDASARRARSIEVELAEVRRRLNEVEPSEQAQTEEIDSLQRERSALQHKLRNLAEREAQLRHSAGRAIELEQERQALEELLDEASEDLGTQEQKIGDLQSRLKTAAKESGGGRARGLEQLTRRLRTLYKNIEIDDRAIQDMLALGDESTKLRAEGGIKRLADDPELASIRRKVGGLPPHLSIFEFGFAGKGRIYYTRGRTQRYRVLLIGAKNSQKTDLEYLSRLPAD